MSQGQALGLVPSTRVGKGIPPKRGIGMFEQQFIQQLMTAFAPQIKELIKEVIAGEGGQPLIVDYEEAGRMIGTTYEGVRKLVRKGKLTAVSRSGRYRGIAVSELKDYVQRSRLMADWQASL